MMILDLIAKILSSFALFSIIVSVFGVIFYGKDLYQKAHCAGINDSFAMPLLIISVAIASGSFFISLKLLITIFFLLITSATSTHCICSLYFQEKNNMLKNKSKIEDNEKL